ncbi:MAG: helix-turn-helix transcriptional regulator [Candidatus Doudnabacteria bacterium]
MRDKFKDFLRRSRGSESQENFGKRLKIPQATLSSWERGKLVPRFRVRDRLAEGLGITRARLDDLIREWTEPFASVDPDQVVTAEDLDFLKQVEGGLNQQFTISLILELLTRRSNVKQV